MEVEYRERKRGGVLVRRGLFYIDSIIIGGSNYDHMTANVKACEEGPLEQSEY